MEGWGGATLAWEATAARWGLWGNSGGRGTVNSGGSLQPLRIALHTISISISLQNNSS